MQKKRKIRKNRTYARFLRKIIDIYTFEPACLQKHGEQARLPLKAQRVGPPTKA
ncbi:MAG: hypothetical protein KAS07_00695 [Candidatus Pacebacteria bacterium]|nr:hypothetical protein [Candidatus Paceibacterota bacterium]